MNRCRTGLWRCFLDWLQILVCRAPRNTVGLCAGGSRRSRVVSVGVANDYPVDEVVGHLTRTRCITHAALGRQPLYVYRADSELK